LGRAEFGSGRRDEIVQRLARRWRPRLQRLRKPEEIGDLVVATVPMLNCCVWRRLAGVQIHGVLP
jgi:hypothetical protein